MSVSKIEKVKTFITALQSGDMGLAADCMADDFVCSGWALQPLDKGDFLALQSELLAALAYYSFNLSDVHEQDEEVEALIALSGTHTRDLTLPLFGIPLIPSTGIAVSLPQQQVTFGFEGDKIVRMSVDAVPGGGLEGLLQQLGSELPVLPRIRDVRQLAEDPIDQEIEEHQYPPWGPKTTIMDEDT